MVITVQSERSMIEPFDVLVRGENVRPKNLIKELKSLSQGHSDKLEDTAAG